MCSHVNLSASQMTRIFRAEFCNTPYAFLLDEKLKVAEDLLHNTSLPLRRIALMLGFANEFYFSRLFRKKRNIPPGCFRK